MNLLLIIMVRLAGMAAGAAVAWLWWRGQWARRESAWQTSLHSRKNASAPPRSGCPNSRPHWRRPRRASQRGWHNWTPCAVNGRNCWSVPRACPLDAALQHCRGQQDAAQQLVAELRAQCAVAETRLQAEVAQAKKNWPCCAKHASSCPCSSAMSPTNCWKKNPAALSNRTAKSLGAVLEPLRERLGEFTRKVESSYAQKPRSVFPCNRKCCVWQNSTARSATTLST